MPRRSDRLLRAVGCLAVTASLLVACGDPEAGSETQLIRGADAAIGDGYLSLSVRLVPGGSPAAGEPITFTLLGPFSAAPAGRQRFDVELATTTADTTAVADVRSTGTRVGVTRHEASHKVADALVARLRRTSHARDASGLPVLGAHVSRWIHDPQKRRSERAAGVPTVRVGGTVDVARLLGDVAGLLADAAGEPTAAALLSAKVRRAAAEAADWDIIDIWSGASDGLLRQLSARVDFTFPRRSVRPGAARRATLEVHVRIDRVNERG